MFPGQDQLSEMLLYVNEIYVEALASNPFHHMEFPKHELAQLTQAMQRRDYRQVLLSSRTRRVLSRMKAATAWKTMVKPISEAQLAEEESESLATAENLRAFLEECSSKYASQATLVVDWKIVNSLFMIHGAQVPTMLSNSNLLRVQRWSPATKLIQVQLEPDEDRNFVFMSITGIHRQGFKLELVDCGEMQATKLLVAEL